MTDSTILYIDDSEGDRVLLQLRLKPKNIVVDAAPSPVVGLEKYKNDTHCLTVIDWNQPGTTGADIAEKIRQKNAAAPLIFISGAFTDKQRMEAEKFAPLACIEKNDSKALVEKIVSLVAKVA